MKVIAVLALVLAAGMGAEANWYKTTTTPATPYNLTALTGKRSRAAAGASTGDIYSLLGQQLAGLEAYHAQLAAKLLSKFKIPVAASPAPAPAPAPKAAPPSPTPVTPVVSGPPATSPSAPAAELNSVAAVAASNPDLSTLVAAVEAAGLTSALSDPNLVATVLAPTNDAFAALLSGLGLTAAEALANTDLLKIVLSYHVIPGVAAKAADLTDGQQLPTQDADQTITVQKNEQGITFVPSAPGAVPAKVVAADIPAGAAIVHVIDQVLVPANALPAAAPPTTEAPVESVATASAGRKMKL